MDKRNWKNRIKRACVAVGTYQKPFDSVIETLAEILERRDRALEEFEEDGELIIEHTNKGGSTNREQNPLIRLINDLNRDALTYWRDLGLTPAGLKRINDAAALKKSNGSALEEALKSIGT